jgi:hypothetical protein
MAIVVYVLCALTSLACAVVLVRGYLRTRESLLLWAGLCFVGLAVNNALLFFDLVVVPTIDLSTARAVVALGGVSVLVFGLVWRDR